MAWLGPLCALASSFTWALGSSGYSRLSDHHTPFAVNFGRALIALPLFLLTAVVLFGGIEGARDGFAQLSATQLGWFTLSMISSYGLGDVLFLFSTRSLGIPGALAISSSYPLLTAAAGAIFHGEILSVLQVAGLLMTIIGVVLVILSTREAIGRQAGASIQKGVLLAIATAFFWATNSYALSRGGRGVDAAIANSIRMVIALLLSFGFSRILAPRSKILMPLSQFKKSFWLFAFEAYGGSYFFVYGLAHSSLAIGATLASLAPVISVPVAWAMGLEKLSFSRTLGVLLVVVGISLLVGKGAVL